MKINIKLEKNIIVKVGFVVMSIVIVGLVTYDVFLIKDINKISDDITNERIEFEKKYQSGLLLKKNNEQLEALLPDLIDLDNSIIKYSETLDFISDLEKESEALGIEQTISIPEIDLGENVTPGLIRLSLNGSPLKVLSYLNVLDRKPYYLNFSKIKISNSKAGSQSSGSMNLILDGKIYWQ